MANEKRLDLVEREAVKDAIGFMNLHFLGHGENKSVLDSINEVPTVDAVEVVHGHWERIEDGYFDLVNLKCSVCGEEWCFEDYDDCLPQNYHYCPNCGAKMDGDGDG